MEIKKEFENYSTGESVVIEPTTKDAGAMEAYLKENGFKEKVVSGLSLYGGRYILSQHKGREGQVMVTVPPVEPRHRLVYTGFFKGVDSFGIMENDILMMYARPEEKIVIIKDPAGKLRRMVDFIKSQTTETTISEGETYEKYHTEYFSVCTPKQLKGVALAATEAHPVSVFFSNSLDIDPEVLRQIASTNPYVHFDICLNSPDKENDVKIIDALAPYDTALSFFPISELGDILTTQSYDIKGVIADLSKTPEKLSSSTVITMMLVGRYADRKFALIGDKPTATMTRTIKRMIEQSSSIQEPERDAERRLRLDFNVGAVTVSVTLPQVFVIDEGEDNTEDIGSIAKGYTMTISEKGLFLRRAAGGVMITDRVSPVGGFSVEAVCDTKKEKDMVRLQNMCEDNIFIRERIPYLIENNLPVPLDTEKLTEPRGGLPFSNTMIIEPNKPVPVTNWELVGNTTWEDVGI